jgi:hypothetical protein
MSVNKVTNVTSHCVSIPNLVSVWIDLTPGTVARVTIGHHLALYGTGLEAAKSAGICWTDDIPALYEYMVGDQMNMLPSFEDEGPKGLINIGKNKTAELIYRPNYGNFVELREGDNIVSISLGALRKLYFAIETILEFEEEEILRRLRSLYEDVEDQWT